MAHGIAAGISSEVGWLPGFLVVIAAGLSAYFGSYLRKKSEFKAAREEFETLHQQLIVTTQSVEEIKSSLAGKGWVRQQHWSHREKHYLELLSQLWIAKYSSEALRVHFERGGNHRDDARVDEFEDRTMTRRNDAVDAVIRAMGPAAVFLPASAVDKLHVLKEQKQTIHDTTDDPYDFYASWERAAETAYRAVLEEAHRDLAIADGETGAATAPQ